jgi:prepilin-type N-terminal cleavage/methylation domain-containing protein
VCYNESTMQWAKQKQSGFTIVELLIVIVVIAILAAITIVAYNGIQNRARDTSVQSTASQLGRKVLANGLQNAEQYPLESSFLQDMSLTQTTQETYDYYVSDDRKKFCVSVTNTAVTPEVAYAFTQSGQSVKGRCVKNLLVNPSFAVDVTAWTQYQSVRTRINGGTQGDGALSIVRTAGATDAMAAQSPPASTIEPNTQYTFSVWSWSDAPRTLLSFTGLQENGTPWRQLAARVSQAVTATPTRYSMTGTTPADVITSTRVTLRSPNVDSATAYFDGVMLTKGPALYSYGDGDTTHWSWVGAQHTSQSFGPATLN